MLNKWEKEMEDIQKNIENYKPSLLKLSKKTNEMVNSFNSELQNIKNIISEKKEGIETSTDLIEKKRCKVIWEETRIQTGNKAILMSKNITVVPIGSEDENTGVSLPKEWFSEVEEV
jgi:hypothetical protein